MKTTILIIFAISSVMNVMAEKSIPYEAKRLIVKRDIAVAKIDAALKREFETLKIKYTMKADLDSANAIVELIKKIDASNTSIQVTSPSDYSVHSLNVGVSRISGLKWSTKFNWVSKDVEGWKFLRVKHRTNDLKTVTFLEDGEVYLTRLDSFKASSISVKKTSVAVKATGPWLEDDKQWYRVTGKVGDSFQCGGSECLIAAKSFKKK